MNVSEQAANLAASPKVAAVVSAATVGTGTGVLDLIPDDIGKLATLVGVVLSGLLIYSHSLTVRHKLIELRRLQDEEAVRLAKTESTPPQE